jgi:O-antigen/teichoic acid export membrane protein
MNKENLFKRAVLNGASAFLDFFIKNITSFIITPFIIRFLGTSLFGAYSSLQQFSGYSNSISLQTSQVLKWKVAKEREVASHDEINSYFSSAFLVTIFTIPILLIAGAFMSYYAPFITGIQDKSLHKLIQITAGLLIFSMIIQRVLEPFESLLRGLNIGYKRIGLRSGIIILSGIGKYYLVINEYNLIYIASLEVFLGTMYGLVFYLIVKKSVGWLKFVRVRLEDMKDFIKLSGWFIGWSFVYNFMFNSDKVLLGVFSSSTYVGQFTILFYLAAFVKAVIINITQSITPGLGKLMGNEDYKKLYEIRSEYINLINCTLTFFLANYILINKLFIILWAKENFTIHNVDIFLLALVVVQFAHIEFDSSLINVTLNIKKKTILSIVSLIIMIVLSSFLIPKFKITGLLISLLISRTILNYSYSRILLKILQVNSKEYNLIRKDFIIFLIFIALPIFGITQFNELFYFNKFYASALYISLNLILIFLIYNYQLSLKNKSKIVILIKKVFRLN